MKVTQQMQATTIFAIRHNGQCEMRISSQVDLEYAVLIEKGRKKVSIVYNDQVLAGFAGWVADVFTLFVKFVIIVQAFDGNLILSAVELAKEWRSDNVLRK